MNARNHYMVKRCDHLIGAWNGSPGGTRNCWRYAEKVGRSRENLLESETFKALRARGGF